MSVKKFLTFLVFNFSLTLNASVKPRVISTIPSITESLYFLEGEKHLIGVTSFCNYPKEARDIEKIGSAFSLNIEKIVTLKPDLVLLAKMQGNRNEKNLAKLGIMYEVFEYSRVSHIPENLKRLNKILKLKKDHLVSVFIERLEKHKLKASGKKVLVVIGEERSGKYLRNIRVAGNQTFYADIVKHLGFEYVIKNSGVEYPLWDYERLLKSDVDIIFRIGDSRSGKDGRANWKGITLSPKSNVKFIFKDYAVVPGPRVLDLMADIRRSYEN